MPAKKTKPAIKTATKSERTAEAAAQRPGLVGSMRGTVLWYGDLISPIDEEWDASYAVSDANK